MSPLRSDPEGVIGSSGERGVILIVVLWLMVFLSVLVGSFAYSTQIGLRLAQKKAAKAEAQAVAQGALAYTAYKLALPSAQNPVPPDGSPIERNLKGGQARISATNLAGLVNLNEAPRALLVRLLAHLGVESEPQQRMADALLDWRDEDDLRRARGAESSAYKQAGRRFGPKNAKFQSIAELHQILGIPEPIAERLGKLVTVQGTKTQVDPRTAPADVLAAITGRDLALIQEFTRQRAQAYRDRTPPPPFPTNSPWLQKHRSPFYRVRLQAEGSRGGKVKAVAVIKLEAQKGVDGRPFRLIEWQEAPA